MKLTPSEILAQLGFHVPADGIEINHNDAYLHTSALRLLGATMNFNAIPEEALQGLDAGLGGLVSVWQGEAVQPRHADVDRLRSTLRLLLEQTYGLSAEG